ncbi:MAG TPA: DUF4331 domain-containing protein [Solirubrobacteraceae bacterium]|nr:DUF4331 domain-containing protein [Solirubrobacteraceae bacterium]
MRLFPTQAPRRSALIALLAALLASAFAVSLSFGSSHREAPSIALDPTADNTDLYAFKANDAPNDVTIVANWIPFEDPAGGPNFYRFDDNADYYVNIDNTGTGRPAIRYLFRFTTHVRDGNTFLYALPGVSSITDPKLNVYQTYSVTRERYRNGHKVSSTVIARNLIVAPNNVGPKTFPDYHTVAAEAIYNLKGGGKVFAGQRDDPFFVDLGATFDGINLRVGTGNQGAGKDDLAGYNVHSVVLQVPESQVTRDGRSVSGPSASNAVVGVWSTTDRPKLTVLTAHGPKPKGSGEVQVSRLGNPLINEVIIPLAHKDQFNNTTPDRDAALYGTYALNPEPARLLNALFGLGVKTTNRTDIVTALLTGIPGKTQIAPNAVPADTLKINLGVPPTAPDKVSRMGVLGGDLGGFPNGRRLGDDVVDIELRVIGGALIGKNLPLGDGVDQNDVPFLTQFPYVAPPHDGFDSALKRIEPKHVPTAKDGLF